jgi:hypothetical protein
MLSLSGSKGNGKTSARTSNPGRGRVSVCVCSDWSSEGRYAGYPWPLGMIPAANRI